MTGVVEVLVNGQWPLRVPAARAAHYSANPEWEPVRLDSMHANLRPGMVLYDIGTEEGDLSALFAQWVRGRPDPTMISAGGLGGVLPDPVPTLPGGGVVLVEPNPRVWPNIRCIWEANKLPPPLLCIEGFIADDAHAQGRLEDHTTGVIGQWPQSASGPIISDHGFRNVTEHPEQLTVTVDHLVFGGYAPPPDAITMDVEGAEWLVARGMQRTLAEHRPLVWVSVHTEAVFHDYGAYQAEFHSLFHAHGYLKCFLGFDHEAHWLYFPEERRADVVFPEGPFIS